MGREFELKYRANPHCFPGIQEKYGTFTPICMETTYFDTFDLKLAFRRWTLRRRIEDEKSVCTVKIPLDDGSRGEWEVESHSIMAGILLLCRSGAPMELMAMTAGGVVPVCGAKFTRLAATVELEDATLELALDQGVLTGAGKEVPFAEVEVELKQGDEAAAVTFAQALAAEFSLTPEPKSKQQRAMELLQG